MSISIACDMTAEPVVVDSSVWIDSFRGGPCVGRVRGLAAGGRALLLAPVAEELLIGARPGEDQKGVAELLRLTPVESPAEVDFLRAGDLGARLRRAGMTVGAIDLLIASQAVRLGSPLWTLDAHFHLIARHCALRLYKTLPIGRSH
jgi:predicted nucleic acid-binding protein